MGLLKLHDMSGMPVVINTDYVTFVQRSTISKGTVVGLMGDDVGCDVREGVDEILAMMCPELGGPACGCEEEGANDQRRPARRGRRFPRRGFPEDNHEQGQAKENQNRDD